ncbi:hypothetical protein CEXT_440721, partial [Caerostris extrusa]
MSKEIFRNAVLPPHFLISCINCSLGSTCGATSLFSPTVLSPLSLLGAFDPHRRVGVERVVEREPQNAQCSLRADVLVGIEITTETTKFPHVVSALQPEEIAVVSDIILKPLADVPFIALKKRLCAQYADSEAQRRLISRIGANTTPNKIVHGVEHWIQTNGPVFSKPRRLPADKLKAAKQEFKFRVFRSFPTVQKLFGKSALHGSKEEWRLEA